MERVQFQQEQMLDELKDLVEKNLFTEKETRQIMKKCTAFETTLVRRVSKKADFLRYASYEMGLEQLRRKRVERIKTEAAPPSISDYALIRRQFHIFERALRKFKSDVGLWIQYIQVAKREGARALVGRITARALQMHPNQPALYILAAAHELNHQSPSSARTLLQRGIRLNADSVDLWREYLRMELGFIESLRRRWDVLGINAGSEDEGTKKGKGADREDPSHHIMHDLPEPEEPAHEPMEEEAEGADSRKEIMEGAIVKSVVTSAVQALPKIELFEALNAVLLEYPSQPSLRQAILEHLHGLLRDTLHQDAGAIKLLAGRFLTPDLKGEAFIEGLRHANEELVQRARESTREEILHAYSEFVEEWCASSIDVNLKLYLISSLRSLIEQKGTSPSLLSAHIRLLGQFANGDSKGSAKILQTARRYSTKAPKSAHVWVARLVAEKQCGEERSTLDKAWAEARRAVKGSDEELETVWTWGLFPDDTAERRLDIHKELLKESMCNAGLHETLLMSYVRVMHEVQTKPDSGLTSDQTTVWLHSIRHMASAYLTSGRVWKKVFLTLEGDEGWGSGADGKRQVLGEVYEKWQRKECLEATLEWARWLLANKKGKEASEVVVAGGRSLGEGKRVELEKQWMGIVGGTMMAGQSN